MRKCKHCNHVKDETFFSKKNICNQCNSSKVKQYYSENPNYRKSSVERAYNLRTKWVTAITQFKMIYGCYFCSENDGCCLQFHHIDPLLKSFHIEGTSKRSLENFRKEIEKCEILCANCHIKLHRGKLSIDNRRDINTLLLEHPGQGYRGRPKKK